jgi:hypothetical protein
MIRSAYRIALLGILVAACSTTVAPTPTPAQLAIATTAPTTAATRPAPTQSPEPSLDADGLPPTKAAGWWGDPDTMYNCARPGSYQIGYRAAPLGDCNGMFNEGPPELTLDVGEDFDLHMTIPADGAQPVWPLPEADDRTVVDSWLIFDRATMTYRGLVPGTTRLVSAGACYRGSPGLAPVPAAPGSCPVLVIHVRDVDWTCKDFTAAECRAIVAAAVRTGWGLIPGQRVVAWDVQPAHFIGGSDCGEGVATVTFTVGDPAGTFDVSIGQLQPAASGPPRYVVCTY